VEERTNPGGLCTGNGIEAEKVKKELWLSSGRRDNCGNAAATAAWVVVVYGKANEKQRAAGVLVFCT
jgi:hypothetical protein